MCLYVSVCEKMCVCVCVYVYREEVEFHCVFSYKPTAETMITNTDSFIYYIPQAMLNSKLLCSANIDNNKY